MITWTQGHAIAALLLLGILLVACQPEKVTVEVPVEVTRVVTETAIEEGETVEVTRVVTEEVIVEVTAEPEPDEEVVFADPSPGTLIQLAFGDIDTMDPAISYDTASGQLLENVMEGLIYFNHKSSIDYVPALATEVPSLENGGISEDGLTYTWKIRAGVKFHEGGDLTPSDVAYSMQRALLQSDPNGPMWLWIEPFMGGGAHDITERIDEGAYAGDPEALRENADPAELVVLCEEVKERVVADDAAGTVTFNLSVPWGPLLATAAGPLGGLVLDMEWAIENGAWDGSCDTWQNFYAPGHENTELGSIVNGTGPYKLETWAPDIGYTLVANEDYWRTEPIWESGPSGVARIPTVVVQVVDEWGTRFARAQVGDADFFTVLPDNRAQVDQFVGEFCNWVTDECVPNPDNPDGPFRKYGALPSVSKSHVFMLFDIPPDSPFIGSGELDGDGIPTDFFADVHVRKAMHYCFDHETFIAEVLNGDGVRTNGPIINDMLGYPEDGPQYDFDLDACEAELEQAHGGLLPETGFRYSAVFNTGNTTRQSALEILQANLASINPDYQLEIVGLPWPGFLHAFRASQIPLLSSGWIEDIHDPHNWAQPFTAGIFANRQRIPDDIRDQFNELVTAGVSSSDPAERQAIYEEMQQLFYDLAISVPLSQVTDAHYEQRWMKDFYHRVGRFGFFFYGYDQEG